MHRDRPCPDRPASSRHGACHHRAEASNQAAETAPEHQAHQEHRAGPEAAAVRRGPRADPPEGRAGSAGTRPPEHRAYPGPTAAARAHPAWHPASREHRAAAGSTNRHHAPRAASRWPCWWPRRRCHRRPGPEDPPERSGHPGRRPAGADPALSPSGAAGCRPTSGRSAHRPARSAAGCRRRRHPRAAARTPWPATAPPLRRSPRSCPYRPKGWTRRAHSAGTPGHRRWPWARTRPAHPAHQAPRARHGPPERRPAG
ncbi:hypothetical protein GA0115234_1041112 [Streptomyces sp. DvalAA-43]|nr:hypothetical protein GA0115234_1041112 [Streptomyces sp. DvalAA-43]